MTEPGLVRPAALRSISASSQSLRPSYSANGGRRTPGGGMTPARSLRTTFSHNSAWSPAVVRSNFSRLRLARFALSLWHVTQYLSRRARCVAADATDVLATAVG